MKPYWQQDGNIIHQGHVLEVLPRLQKESVHMCVTSPPYWGLRDYGLPPVIWDGDSECEHVWGNELSPRGQSGWYTFEHKYHSPGCHKTTLGSRLKKDTEFTKNTGHGQFCQICGAWRGSYGLEPTPELYIKHTVDIFREVRRVLRKDGTLWLNLGDSYAGGGRGFGYGGKQDTNKGCETMPKSIIPSGLKPKDLVGIPWRVALALQADGWWLRSDIIWHKPNPMPESVTDRPTKSHEYLFLLTKSGKSQYWAHRDHIGTRKKPKADWRWINQVDETEVSKPPLDWKLKIICPECNGVGIADVDMGYKFMGQFIEYHQSEKCPVCDGKKKVQKWKRVNLWRGRDYFYDAEAIREADHPDGRKQTIRRQTDRYTGNLLNPFQDGEHERWSGSRNKRTVWTIPTKPFPQAHFATFPPALVEPCILAGTSEKGCCVECGSPWERVVEKQVPELRNVKSDYPGQHTIATRKYKHNESGTGSKTTGWKPTCDCETPGTRDCKLAERGRYCTVLDPFGGAMTTAIVAHKYGRKFTMIELSQNYIDKIGIPRIKQETKQLKLW